MQQAIRSNIGQMAYLFNKLIPLLLIQSVFRLLPMGALLPALQDRHQLQLPPQQLQEDHKFKRVHFNI